MKLWQRKCKEEGFQWQSSVLQNNTQFSNTDYQPETLTVQEYIQAEAYGAKASMQITKFAVVDLDCDGTPEVILGVTTSGPDFVNQQSATSDQFDAAISQ